MVFVEREDSCAIRLLEGLEEEEGEGNDLLIGCGWLL